MARRLRLVYEGAIYHVLNRGNYRRDVFETDGAARAFETALGEACERHGWLLHTYVVMRNHYHLVLETPRPNLIEGMQWLQGTFAARFNRLRSEQGHLFQGRYRALVVEGGPALVRLVNYVHLNPVRARVVSAEHVADYPWSGLMRFVQGEWPPWLTPHDWLGHLGLMSTKDGWDRYLKSLIELAGDDAEQERQGFELLSKGWAIGSEGWRVAVAKDQAHLKLHVGVARDELRELDEARWREALNEALARNGKSHPDLEKAARHAPWKVQIATQLRCNLAVPYRWIAQAMNLGEPATLRVYVRRHLLRVSP